MTDPADIRRGESAGAVRGCARGSEGRGRFVGVLIAADSNHGRLFAVLVAGGWIRGANSMTNDKLSAMLVFWRRIEWGGGGRGMHIRRGDVLVDVAWVWIGRE